MTEMNIQINIKDVGFSTGTVGWLKKNIKNFRMRETTKGNKGIWCDIGDKQVLLCLHDEEMRQYLSIPSEDPCIVCIDDGIDYIRYDYGQNLYFLTPAAVNALIRISYECQEKLKDHINKDDTDDIIFKIE